MKFKYIGGSEDAPETAVAFGYTFELNGDAVEVSEQDIARKLLGNKTFSADVIDVDTGLSSGSVENTNPRTRNGTQRRKAK